MKKNIVFLFIILFFFYFSVTGVSATNRIALIIGNGAYNSAPLKNPVNDATDMAAILKSYGFEVTLVLNASNREMKNKVKAFGNKLRESKKTGLFYYAGHGMQVNGRNYLIPIGCAIESEGDVEFEALDAGIVLNKMEDAQNELNIVILDACRNNPFAKSFRSSTKGLARMDAPKGSIIAYATAPGELSADGDGRNGVYTKHLLKNIIRPGVPIEKMFKNVRVSVLNDTANRQIPWESSSLTGDFYFNIKNQIVDKTNPITLQQKNLSKVNNSPQKPFRNHITKHHGLSTPPLKIGLSGHYLAISTKTNGYQHLFNITQLLFENDKLPYYSNFILRKTRWKDYYIRLQNNREFSDTIEIRNLGTVVQYLKIDSRKNGSISAFTFTDQGNIFCGTKKGALFLYDRNGALIQHFLLENEPVLHCLVQNEIIAVLFQNGHIVILKNIEKTNRNSTFITLMK